MKKRAPESPLFSPRRGAGDLVRYLYLEPLLPGKDVLVVGAATDADAAGFLDGLSVRSAVATAPPERPPLPQDMTAVRGRTDSRAADRGGLPFRDGAFDVVFVPEVADAPDPGLLLEEVARVLRPGGLALAATRNASCLCPISIPPDGGHAEIWTYSRLLALLRAYFPSVRMVGQGPFLGYTFVEYDPRAVPDVRLDTSLMKGRGEDPEFFVAVCSPDASGAVELPLPALFQTPIEEFTVAEATADERSAPAVTESAAIAALDAEEEALALRGDVERLREELAERNVRIARLEQEVRRAEENAAGARDRATKLVKEIEADRKDSQRKVLETTFAKAARQGDWSPPPAADPAADAARAEAGRLRGEVAERDRTIEMLRGALRETESKAAQAAGLEAAAHVREVEDRLRAAGKRIAELDRIATERASIVEDLLRDLRCRPEPAPPMPAEPEPVAPPPPRAGETDREAAAGRSERAMAEAWAGAESRAAALQETVSRLQGELTGATWRNAELEAALAETFDEVRRLEEEMEHLRGSLEVAQLAAEEMARTGAAREAEMDRLRADIERLAPLEAQAAAVGRLVSELQRQASDLREILEAREEELRQIRGRSDGA